jgi:hypothetical protein
MLAKKSSIHAEYAVTDVLPAVSVTRAVIVENEKKRIGLKRCI